MTHTKVEMTYDWSKVIEYLNKTFTLDGTTQRMCGALFDYLANKYDGARPHEAILHILDAFGFEESDLEKLMDARAVEFEPPLTQN